MAPEEPEPPADPVDPVESADPATESDPEPDPEQARQSTASLYWIGAGVSLLVGAFQYLHSLGAMHGFDVLAVLGLVVMTLLLLGLAAIYALCALQRADLRDRLGRFDLFQVSTVLLVAAVLVGVLIPPRTTTVLGLLLPWGIGYWLYHLAAQQEAQQAAEE
ncbi:hypothetical protein ACI2LF_03975 [Kribbella sp. NPDC020789]